jgi:hypothetical protein
VASIPIKYLDADWSAAEVLTRKLLPPEAASDPSSLTNPAFGFSREGDFNSDGLKDKALVGVYRTKAGQTGTFLLVLTRQVSGKWQKVFLEKVPGTPGFSVLWSDGKAVRWYHCMECDTFAVLIPIETGYRIEWQHCCDKN